jgi:hypothetical protein
VIIAYSEIFPKWHLPGRHFPGRHLPAMKFAHNDLSAVKFARETFARSEICPEDIFPQENLPAVTFSCSEIYPQWHLPQWHLPAVIFAWVNCHFGLMSLREKIFRANFFLVIVFRANVYRDSVIRVNVFWANVFRTCVFQASYKAALGVSTKCRCMLGENSQQEHVTWKLLPANKFACDSLRQCSCGKLSSRPILPRKYPWSRQTRLD